MRKSFRFITMIPGYLRIHKEAVLVDAHCDTTLRLLDSNFNIVNRYSDGHFDIPRALEGGVDVVFFAIFVPDYEDPVRAYKEGLRQIEAIHLAVKRNSDKAGLAPSYDDITTLISQGRLAVMIAMENCNPIGENIDSIDVFYKSGVRVICPQRVKADYAFDIAYHQRWGKQGLSDFEKMLINEMNKRRIIVDISHLSKKAKWEVLEMSSFPVIASHIGCERFCKTIYRNLDDEMIRAVAQKGGVINVFFCPELLSQEFRNKYIEIIYKIRPQLKKIREIYDNEWGFLKELRKLLLKENISLPDVNIVIDHIEYIINLVGIDYVGIGSDFDGVIFPPIGLEDVSKLPILTRLFLERGYRKEDIAKILGGNMLRVIAESKI
ncbi:MAG: dipeptidase [Candidatus Omnitrophica bacterium]|nr:dipeptidase [Candidatus Omnitrophota bacterium]